MGLFSKKKPEIPVKTEEPEERYYYNNALNFNSISTFTNSSSMKLSAVFSAVNAISNAVAVLPLNTYIVDTDGYKQLNVNNRLNNLLNVEPSFNITRFKFFKQIVSSIILKGSGYALIQRDEHGSPIQLLFLQPDSVGVNYDPKTRKVSYSISGIKNPISSEDILHFFMNSDDGITGKSTISYGVDVLKGSKDAETFASNFYKSGASTNGVLKTTTALNANQVQQIKNSWSSAFNGDSLGVVILPIGTDYQPISINSRDSQLLESRQFSVIEIARIFNISPIKLFDYQHNSYATLEQVQLSFLSDTVNPYLVMIELELNRKLFNVAERELNVIKFDREFMLETDKQATAAYYKDLINNGLMTVNEARKKLGLTKYENGDKLFMQLNMSTIDNLVNSTPAPVNDNIQQKTKVADKTTTLNKNK